jgi:hypothetical protein
MFNPLMRQSATGSWVADDAESAAVQGSPYFAPVLLVLAAALILAAAAFPDVFAGSFDHFGPDAP